MNRLLWAAIFAGAALLLFAAAAYGQSRDAARNAANADDAAGLGSTLRVASLRSACATASASVSRENGDVSLPRRARLRQPVKEERTAETEPDRLRKNVARRESQGRFSA